MDVISKKCYYGKMLETLDPLSISTIDVTPFEVYSKIPGEKCLIMMLEELVHLMPSPELSTKISLMLLNGSVLGTEISPSYMQECVCFVANLTIIYFHIFT